MDFAENGCASEVQQRSRLVLLDLFTTGAEFLILEKKVLPEDSFNHENENYWSPAAGEYRNDTCR